MWVSMGAIWAGSCDSCCIYDRVHWEYSRGEAGRDAGTAQQGNGAHDSGIATQLLCTEQGFIFFASFLFVCL